MNIGQEINRYSTSRAFEPSISPVNSLDDLVEGDESIGITNLYGHWVVGDVVFRDITSVAKDGQGKSPSWSEDLVGSTIEYKENAIILNDKFYEIKGYKADLEYFDVHIKRLNMLDDVHLDFMNNNDLVSTECFLVSFDPVLKSHIDPKIGANFIILNENHILFFKGGCYFDGYRVDIINLDSFELPTPPEPADPQYLYGKWVVQYTMNGDDSNSKQYIGHTLEYQKDFIILEDIVFNNPQYSYDVPLPDKEFNKWFPHVEDDILLGIRHFYPQYIFIDGNRLNTFGEHVYYINDDNILVFHDSILYRAKRSNYNNFSSVLDRLWMTLLYSESRLNGFSFGLILP